jgi:hypothetical protein
MDEDYLFPELKVEATESDHERKKPRFERDLEKHGSINAVKASKADLDDRAEQVSMARRRGGSAAVRAALSAAAEEAENAVLSGNGEFDDLDGIPPEIDEPIIVVDNEPDDISSFNIEDFNLTPEMMNEMAHQEDDDAYYSVSGTDIEDGEDLESVIEAAIEAEIEAKIETAIAEEFEEEEAEDSNQVHLDFSAIADEAAFDAEALAEFGRSIKVAGQTPTPVTVKEIVEETAALEEEIANSYIEKEPQVTPEQIVEPEPAPEPEPVKAAVNSEAVASASAAIAQAAAAVQAELEEQTIIKRQQKEIVSINAANNYYESTFGTGNTALPILGDLGDEISSDGVRKSGKAKRSDDEISQIRKREAAAMSVLSEDTSKAGKVRAERVTFDTAEKEFNKKRTIGWSLLLSSNLLLIIIGIIGIIFFEKGNTGLVFLFRAAIGFGLVGVIPVKFVQKVLAPFYVLLALLFVMLGLTNGAITAVPIIFYSAAVVFSIYSFAVRAFSFSVKTLFQKY